MKIKSLNVDAFGKFKNKNVVFGDGLNLVYAENESGKSTIAEFIKCMFYGIDSSSRSVRENQRLRYAPPDGSKMGGSLEFSSSAGEFRISRYFGKKKSEDKKQLLNMQTGLPEIGSGEYGDMLLDIDSNSFCKMNYIKQLAGRLENDKNDSILTRLLNLSQTGEELVSYQSSLKILRDAERSLSYRGRGVISSLREEALNLYSERDSARAAEEQKAEIKLSIKTLESEKEELELKRTDSSLLMQTRSMYCDWQTAEKGYTIAMNNLTAKYGKINEDLQNEKKRCIFSKKLSLRLFAVSIFTSFFSFMYSPLIFALLPAFLLFLVFMNSSASIDRIGRELIAKSKEFEGLKPVYNASAETWFREKFGKLSLDDVPELIDSLEASFENESNLRMQRILDCAGRINSLKTKLSLISCRSAAEIDADINKKTAEIKHYEDIMESIKTAEKYITESFYELKSRLGPRINEECSKVLSLITNGRYKRVIVDENYNMILIDDCDNTIPCDYLSTGTYDQIYFSLRMAIISLLAPELPIIVDDAFNQYDDLRHNLVIKYLSSLSNQVILFTCHKRGYFDDFSCVDIS